MRKYLALFLALVMALTLAACGGSSSSAAPAEESKSEEAAPASDAEAPAEATDNLVGVAMPTKDLQRWNQDGENMKAMLEAAGYTVDLQYGANDIPTQVSQIENMIANGCIIWDYNAKVGGQEIPGITGKLGVRVQNEAGQRLIE